jgi:outer membrane receptor protein involved in Fe transport
MTSERRSHHSVSDSAGAFGMTLAPGRWRLKAEILGYQSTHLDIDINASEGAATVATLRLRAQALMMDEMVVRARRLGAQEHSAVFVESIRMAELGTYDVDVSEILDSAVGVDVRRYGGLGSFSAISIRGSTAEQVQIYLDGVPLTRAVGGGVDLGTLPVRGIKSIEAIPSMSATAASPGSATSSPCTRASTDGATRPSWRRSGRLPAAGLRTG